MKNCEKYTCIFGGGAVRGFTYIGAIKALKEMNFNIDTILGSSVGSIFAALLALGYEADELKKIFININFDLFKDIRFGFDQFAISKGNVFTNWVREAIEKKYYGDSYKKGKNNPVTFKDIRKELVILATDLNEFKPFEFSKNNTPDYEIAEAIKISCSMPCLMPTVELNDKILLDGDLLKSIPLWKLSKTVQEKQNRIIEFRLEGDNVKLDTLNPIEFLNSVYSCATCASTDFLIDEFGNNDKYDFIKIVTDDLIIVDFNITEETRNNLINKGYIATKDYMKRKAIPKKQKIYDCYNKINQYLTDLNQYLIFNDAEKSIAILKDLFIILTDNFKIIDNDIIESIKTLKNDIFKQGTGKSWFKKLRFKNTDDLLTQTKLINKVIDIKIDELYDFIHKPS